MGYTCRYILSGGPLPGEIAVNQRLFFLFPDREHALTAVNELVEKGFDTRHMHALAGRGSSVEGLPRCNAHQEDDYAARLEFWGWRLNLALFFLSAVALLLMIVLQAGLWMVLPLFVMVASFLLGERFTHLPNTHLEEFRAALSHGEVLLMVDTPQQRAVDVEQQMHHHPEVISGGASWNLPALGT